MAIIKASLAAAAKDRARRERERDQARIAQIQKELGTIAHRHRETCPTATDRISTAISWLVAVKL